MGLTFGEVPGFLFPEWALGRDIFKTEHDINIYQSNGKQVLSVARVLISVPRQPWRRIKHEKDNIN